MRLDLFLKTSRLVPRRSVAQEFCDAGQIFVNESAAKSSKEIKAGDLIEIKRASRVTKVLVSQVPATKQVSKNAAAELYEVVEETALGNDPLS
ncbi:MAG TPA: S4 domain-containing protein [Pyrinomonadaceae bacterium]|nr:S4 domain-containing protein [Pyrinomonadaceae bacterium]